MGFRTKDGRSLEAGIKGFWYEYHNIFALVRDLGIPWPFTPWSRSGFWGPRGLSIEVRGQHCAAVLLKRMATDRAPYSGQGVCYAGACLL